MWPTTQVMNSGVAPCSTAAPLSSSSRAASTPAGVQRRRAAARRDGTGQLDGEQAASSGVSQPLSPIDLREPRPRLEAADQRKLPRSPIDCGNNS